MVTKEEIVQLYSAQRHTKGLVRLPDGFWRSAGGLAGGDALAAQFLAGLAGLRCNRMLVALSAALAAGQDAPQAPPNCTEEERLLCDALADALGRHMELLLATPAAKLVLAVLERDTPGFTGFGGTTYPSLPKGSLVAVQEADLNALPLSTAAKKLDIAT